MLVGAKKLLDFATEAQRNTRVREDPFDKTQAVLELASKNLLPNPDFRDRNPDGTPQLITLGHADEPSGWGFYARQVTDSPVSTRQNLQAFPISRDLYTQMGPLIEGPEAQDVTRRAKIARPETPMLSLKSRNAYGYPRNNTAGYRALAYAFIIPGGLTTGPSSRSYVRPEEGQGMDVLIPALPEGATGIVLYMTKPCDTENLASREPLFEQRRLGGLAAKAPTYRLAGPFFRGTKAAPENAAFVGGAGENRRPVWGFARNTGNLSQMQTQLSYSFLTSFGWSVPQLGTHLIGTGARTKTSLRWHPPKLPPGAKAWKPQILGSDSTWYELRARPLGVTANVYTNDPEQLIGATQLDRGFLEEGEDQTGMPDPDAPLEAPTYVFAAALTPGVYEIKTVLYDEEGRETPPSPPTVINVPAGQTFVVKRPRAGNEMENADLSVEDTETRLPSGWEFPVLPEDIAKNEVVLSGSALAAREIARTPAVRMSGEQSTRIVLEPLAPLSGAASGEIEISLVYYGEDATAQAQSQAQMQSASSDVSVQSVGAELARKIIGKVSANASGQKSEFTSRVHIEAPNGSVYSRVVIRQNGSSSSSTSSNVRVNITSPGTLPGAVIPPKHLWRPSEVEITKPLTPGGPVPTKPPVGVPEEDDPNAPYPPGGGCLVVRNPKRRHADLVGKEINAAVYYGPPGTPPSDEYFLTGYRTTIVGGLTHALSCYADWRGVKRGTKLLRAVLKDEFGKVVQILPHLIPNVVGDREPERFHRTFVADPRAVTIEFDKGGGSDGYIRAMAFQLEESDRPTSYTNENAFSGYRRVTIDTGLSGVPDSSHLAFIARVRDWVQAKMTETVEEGLTRVDLSMRSTNDSPVADGAVFSEWTADFEAVPRRRFWQLEVGLYTTDTLESPEVRGLMLEIIRSQDILLRPDFSEYERGMQVANLPVHHPRSSRTETLSDSNVAGFRVRGRKRVMFGDLSLECYSERAIEDLLEDLDSGDGTVVAESPEGNRRLVLRLDPESITFERSEGRYEFDAPHHWIFTADGISGEVFESEDLEYEPHFLESS